MSNGLTLPFAAVTLLDTGFGFSVTVAPDFFGPLPPGVTAGESGDAVHGACYGSGSGVSGVSTTGPGVSGSSESGNGVHGTSQTGNAGFFAGNVVINGKLLVNGVDILGALQTVDVGGILALTQRVSQIEQTIVQIENAIVQIQEQLSAL
jgi:hypothetical protein